MTRRTWPGRGGPAISFTWCVFLLIFLVLFLLSRLFLFYFVLLLVFCSRSKRSSCWLCVFFMSYFLSFADLFWLLLVSTFAFCGRRLTFRRLFSGLLIMCTQVCIYWVFVRWKSCKVLDVVNFTLVFVRGMAGLNVVASSRVCDVRPCDGFLRSGSVLRGSRRIRMFFLRCS